MFLPVEEEDLEAALRAEHEREERSCLHAEFLKWNGRVRGLLTCWLSLRVLSLWTSPRDGVSC